MNYEIEYLLSYFFIAGIFFGIVFLCFRSIIDYIKDSNYIKNENIKYYLENDNSIKEQQKKHHIVSKEATKKISTDFDVDFTLNTNNSIVKTEPVYAE